MPRFMVTDPSRLNDPNPEDPNTFHDCWNDVQDEIPDLDGVDQPDFGKPMQVDDGNITLTITRLQ